MGDGQTWPDVDGRCAHCAGGLGAADVDGFRRCERCGRAVAPAVAPIVRTSGPPWPVIVAVVLLIGAVAVGFEVSRRDDEPTRTPDRTSPEGTTTVAPLARGGPDVEVVAFPEADRAVFTTDPGSPVAHGPLLPIDRRLVVVPGADGGPSSVVAIARDGDSADELVLRLEPEAGGARVAGTSALLGGSAGQQGRLFVAGDTAFVRSDRQVLSFAPDGRRTAAVELPRTGGFVCGPCDLVVGDRFVTSDETGQLVALDGATPEPTWRRGLGVPPLDLDTDGRSLFVAHRFEDRLALSVISGDAGAVERATTIPCGRGARAEPGDSPWAIVRRVPGTAEVVVVASGSDAGVCVARLDPGTGTVAWSLGVDEVGNGRLDEEILVQAGLLAFRSNTTIAWVDLETGAFRSRTEISSAIPIAATETLLVVENRDSDGMATFQAYERATGDRVWSIRPDPDQLAVLGAEGHIGAGDSSGAALIVAVASSRGLHAVTVDAVGRRITIRDLDPSTGEPSSARAFALPDPKELTWRGTEGALLLERSGPDRIVVQYGPWTAELPLVGTEGAWVWTAG